MIQVPGLPSNVAYFQTNGSGFAIGIPTIRGLSTDIGASTANATLIANALSYGGQQQLPPGKFYVDVNVLKATLQGSLFGAGANNGGYFFSTTQAGSLAEQAAGTTLATTSRTGWILGLDVSGFSVEGIHFQNESAVNGSGIATAGGGVRLGSLVGSTGIASSQANGARIQNCSSYGCYVGLDLYSADSYVMSQNIITNFVSAGIQINNLYNPNTGLVYDFGDPIIQGNQITSGIFSANAFGIYYIAGGGLKIVGNKINGNGLASVTYYLGDGIRLKPSTVSNSGVMTIVGNSIEGINNNCVLMDTSLGSSANLTNITVSGNEFHGPSATCVCLNLVSGGGNLPGTIYFGENTVSSCFSLVKSNLAQGLKIGPNVVFGTNLGGPLIDIENGIGVGYNLNDQVINTRAANTTLLLDKTGINYNSSSQRMGTEKRVVREMPALNLTPTAVNLFTVDIGSSGNSACQVEVNFSGFMSGVGPYTHTLKRALLGANGNATVATIGTDYFNGTQLLNWTFVPSSGNVTVAANCNASAGLNVSPFAGIASGEVRLTIDGTVRQLIVV